MNPYSPSPALAVAIVTAQLFGPAVLWAAEQRGIRVEANRQIVVSALSGNQLTIQGEQGTTALLFREVVPEGATLTTGAGTTAEVLIGNRAVVTLGKETTAQVRTVSADQTTIQITKGTVRMAAAASAVGPQGWVTVQTPTSHVQTRGGILRVTVDAPLSKAESTPTEAQVYRAAYTPEPMVAALTPPSDIIHVEEGTAEIPGVGPTGGSLTMQAGQRVMVQAGRAGSLAEAVNPGAATTGVLATSGHAQTPKEGRDHLVALQIDQASQLGKAITGAAETGSKESDKNGDSKNTINGATGGVTLANALFGTGSAANPTSGGTLVDRGGAGYGGHNSSGFKEFVSDRLELPRNGSANALLVFTRKDPITAIAQDNRSCTAVDCFAFDSNGVGAIVPTDDFKEFKALPAIPSSFRVDKELVVVGGATNEGHGGIPPSETLTVRGAAPQQSVSEFTNKANTIEDPTLANGLYLSDRQPLFTLGGPSPKQIVASNSNFVVEKRSEFHQSSDLIFGGTLGLFSNRADGAVHDRCGFGQQGCSHDGQSFIDGAITATSTKNRSHIVLSGGVTLDQQTTATIGTTKATDTYFTGLPGTKFTGSLLSVINGPDKDITTSVTMQDRMLGVYDGSVVKIEGGNKALLSVLDAKLKGPSGSIPLIDIAAGSHFTLGDEVALDGTRTVTETPGSSPNVTVTSALVTRSTIPLDGALLEASAPLFALTSANPCTNTTACTTMTTTSHFADLAGNRAQSVNLGDALVALDASKLIINSGHLLNLNSATAAIGGYLFSLTNGSQLDIKNGALFSLNNGSSLALNGTALGVFGTGTNTLSIDNNLCGAGAACGALVNSAGQAITLQDGTALHVSGVTQNVVLPNGFNAFALAPGATASSAKIDIDANDALFHIDPTSTLTINGTKVK